MTMTIWKTLGTNLGLNEEEDLEDVQAVVMLLRLEF